MPSARRKSPPAQADPSARAFHMPKTRKLIFLGAAGHVIGGVAFGASRLSDHWRTQLILSGYFGVLDTAEASVITGYGCRTTRALLTASPEGPPEWGSNAAVWPLARTPAAGRGCRRRGEQHSLRPTRGRKRRRRRLFCCHVDAHPAPSTAMIGSDDMTVTCGLFCPV